MTLITLSSSVWADAPGYTAGTTIDGGATLGYWAIGSCLIETPPMTRMKSAITHAKIGRSMKNWAMAGQRGVDAEAAATAPLAAPLAPGGCHGTGFTGAAPRSFWKPSTITISPVLTPSGMTQLPLCAVTPFTGRGVTLPS